METDATLAAKMQTIKGVPTAVWLDSIDAIEGGAANGGRLGLEAHLLEAVAQQQALAAAGNNQPMTITLVIYNLPDRDCAALASNGTLFGLPGLATY